LASPGVIDSTKFVTPQSNGFKSYLKYMNRSEAVRAEKYSDYNVALDDLKEKDFETYNYYMSNPEKTSALFNSKYDYLTPEQMEGVMEQFSQAQRNQSLMWQHVISFDNPWLEKHGHYNPLTHDLDETTVMRATRNAMTELIHNEKMNGAVWTAAIHYNTDNIHVHIAMVEPHPTRDKYYPIGKDGERLKDPKTGKDIWEYRGKIAPKHLERIKSQVASAIADQSEMLSKIDLLSRKQIGQRDKLYRGIRGDRTLQRKYDEIYRHLPAQSHLWKYNNNALSEVRPMIDDFIDYYIETYHAERFGELNNELDKAVSFYKETYGESRYDDFKDNKLNDLRASLGNGLLKDMQEYKRSVLQQAKLLQKYDPQGKYFKGNSRGRGGSLRHLNDAFEKSYEQIKNERAYERLKDSIEYDFE